MAVIPIKRVPKGACCAWDHDVDGNCMKHPYGVCLGCGATKPAETGILGWMEVTHWSGGGPNITGSYCRLHCLQEAMDKS